jgi:hypothetical protein
MDCIAKRKQTSTATDHLCDMQTRCPRRVQTIRRLLSSCHTRNLRFSAAFGLLLMLMLLNGCGSARAGRFEAFAAAGAGYTQVRSEFLRYSLETTIDRDTFELRRQQAALDRGGRIRVLGEQDAILKERIEIINDLERHGQVLRQYFAALSRLATSKDNANAGVAATRLSGELGGLTNALATKSIGGNPISNLLGQGTTLAVGSFRNRALASHLKENAATIDRELHLEEELLGVLAEELIADKLALQAEERRNRVVLPFRDADSLSPAWNEERKRFLMTQVDIGKARAAQEAARQLRLSYEALAGGSAGGSVLELENAVRRLSEFVNDFAQSQQPSP